MEAHNTRMAVHSPVVGQVRAMQGGMQKSEAEGG